MSKQNVKGDKQKNSKLVTTQVQVSEPKKEKIKLTPDTTAVLTVYMPGSFKKRASNAATKKQKCKMALSPLLMENKNGRFTRQRISHPSEWFTTDGWRQLAPGEKIRDYYEGPKTYEEYEIFEYSVKLPLSAETLQYYTTEDCRPHGIKAEDWKSKSKVARIFINAEITASDMAKGSKFRFELTFLN